MLYYCMNIDKDREKSTSGFQHRLSSRGGNEIENFIEIKVFTTLNIHIYNYFIYVNAHVSVSICIQQCAER